jgi:hypothetical protein
LIAIQVVDLFVVEKEHYLLSLEDSTEELGHLLEDRSKEAVVALGQLTLEVAPFIIDVSLQLVEPQLVANEATCQGLSDHCEYALVLISVLLSTALVGHLQTAHHTATQLDWYYQEVAGQGMYLLVYNWKVVRPRQLPQLGILGIP